VKSFNSFPKNKKPINSKELMLIVALTGGIASGKSVVADVLKELGCYINQADKIAHQLMEPGQFAWEKIVSHFGKDILNKNNTINRSKLGTVVFSEEKERLFLNRIIHPLVFKRQKNIIQDLQEKGQYKIFISEAALTIEANLANFFDKIIVVYCKQEIQLKRLIKRDQISKTEAIKKMKSQLTPEKKLKYADYIVDTSGIIESTIEQTERIYRNLILDYKIKYQGSNFQI